MTLAMPRILQQVSVKMKWMTTVKHLTNSDH